MSETVDGSSCVPANEIAAIAGASTAGALENPYFGKILDTDGHMYIEPGPLGEMLEGLPDPGGFIMKFLSKYSGSEADREARAHNREKIWDTKGISALGATDAHDRIEALDRLGVRSQFIFPNTFCAELRMNTEAAFAACRRYNDYAFAWARQSGDANRLRMVAQINTGSFEFAYGELQRVAKMGCKVITLPCAKPPAGVSPAHNLWDPFWALCEEAQIAVTLHLGAGGLTASNVEDDPMLPDRGWSDAPSLRVAPADRTGGEEAVSPYFLLVAHIPAETFLISAVMGGLFERFPALRFGLFEFGTDWIGPTVRRMDAWAGFLSKVAGVKYSMKPSEFVRRNVRTAPFFHEDFATTAEQYGLHEIFCVMTDYPHLEGGRNPFGAYMKTASKLGPKFANDFFMENAKWLFPDLAA
jgi:predicted TIM-barrel fold metal-dependent hydrolase